MKTVGCGKYFGEFWNWMDVIVIVIALVCIGFNLYRTFTVEKVLDGLLSAPEQFPDFETLGYWQMQFNYGIAITAFFAWAKVIFLHFVTSKNVNQIVFIIFLFF